MQNVENTVQLVVGLGCLSSAINHDNDALLRFTRLDSQERSPGVSQLRESFEFEIDIFLSAGVSHFITEDHMEKMKDLTLCRVHHGREVSCCIVELVAHLSCPAQSAPSITGPRSISCTPSTVSTTNSPGRDRVISNSGGVRRSETARSTCLAWSLQIFKWSWLEFK